MFGNAVGIGAKVKTNGESQGAVIENFVLRVAIWQDEAAAINQCRSATTECCAYAVCIHSIAMIEVERAVRTQEMGFSLSPFFVYGLGFLLALVILVIALVEHKSGRILHPNVDTKRLFTSALQGRTIRTVCATVVFPCQVVFSHLVNGTINLALHGFGATRGGVNGEAAHGKDAGVDQQFVVVGDL